MGADYRTKSVFIIGGNMGDASLAANTTRFHQLYGGRGQAAEGRMIFHSSIPMILDQLRVNTETPPGVGETVTFMLRQELGDTLLTAQVAGAVAIEATDLVNAVLINVDDRIDMRLVSSAGAAVTWCGWCMRARPL